MPREMNVPRPPAPMYAAIAVTPMLITTEMRTPAMITGSAIGISTRARRCEVDMPIPTGAQRGIHVGGCGVGVADDGQLPVEHRGNPGGQPADAMADLGEDRDQHAE